MLHLVDSSILLYLIDDGRSNKNQVVHCDLFLSTLTACVFVTQDTVRHPRRFVFGKFVRKPNCSWSEAFVNRGLTVFLSKSENRIFKKPRLFSYPLNLIFHNHGDHSTLCNLNRRRSFLNYKIITHETNTNSSGSWTLLLPTDAHNVKKTQSYFTQILLTKCVIFSQALTLAPWRWFLCKPKHVGAFLLVLEFFNNSVFFNIMCISW